MRHNAGHSNLQVINEKAVPNITYLDDFPCKGEAYGNRANIEYSDKNRKTTMVFWHAYPLSKQPDLNRQAKKFF